MKGWLGRALAVVGAACVVWAVACKSWWHFVGGSALFEDQTGRLGLYDGIWCSDVWCNGYHMERAGKTFDKLGAVAFFIGLVAAACLLMLALARSERARVYSRTAIGAVIATVVACGAAAISRHVIAPHTSYGAGLYVLLVGAALAITGALLVARSPGTRRLAVKAPVGRVIVVAACVLAFVSLAGRDFWYWQWMEEHDHVGLDSTEKCWEHENEPRPICSSSESVSEIFMYDRDDPPRFAKLARQTLYAGLAAVVLAILAAFAPALGRGSRWAARTEEVAHAPWVVLLVLSVALYGLTPDLGEARHIQLGYDFIALWFACLLGIAGGVLGATANSPRTAPP